MRKATPELDLDLDHLLRDRRANLDSVTVEWWAPRCLLPRLDGDARSSGHGLRHPLRVRHVSPGDPRRLAGGADRLLAALRQSLGDPPSPGGRRGRASAATPSMDGRVLGQTRSVGPNSSSREFPTIHPSLGYRSGIANYPKAMAIRATRAFYSRRFNSGDYQGAVGAKFSPKDIQGVVSQR